MNAIELRALVKEFPAPRGLREALRHPLNPPTARVLTGLDLSVEHGEILGILGSNGAGKTTLLKILATLVRPTAGTAVVEGLDVVRDEKKVRSLVSYSFTEERSFYWRMSGRDNLEFFAALEDIHGAAARRRIEAAAESLGVTEYLDIPYSRFSTGIRQRFSLARALLKRPRVLLLDEPTRSIDQAAARDVWQLVRTVRDAEDITVLVVTHQAEEAAAVCDRIVLLDSGRIGSQLQPGELRRAMTGLHGLVVMMEGFPAGELRKLEAIPGVRKVALTRNDGQQQLDVWCDNGDLALSELVAAITASGASVRGLSETTPVSEIVQRLAGSARK